MVLDGPQPSARKVFLDRKAVPLTSFSTVNRPPLTAATTVAFRRTLQRAVGSGRSAGDRRPLRRPESTLIVAYFAVLFASL
jgi:hypothetical protein